MNKYKPRKTSEKEFETIRKIKDSDIDFSDIPELSDNEMLNIQLIQPDEFLEDHNVPKKSAVNIRLDDDVIDFFKSHSSQYQTAINKA